MFGTNPAPFVRKGENALTSRGFMFSRLGGVATGKIGKEYAKVEMDLCERTRTEYVERGFYRKEEANSVTVPMSSELMVQADPSMQKFAGLFARKAQAEASTLVVEIDADHDGVTEYAISLGSTNTRHG